MNTSKTKTIGIVLAGAVVAFFVWQKAADVSLSRAVVRPATAESVMIHFSITPGQTVAEIARGLEQAKIVADADVFGRYARKLKQDTSIKPGEYTLDSSMTPKQILAILVSGDREEAWITIPEGWRLDQIADYLEAQGLAKADDFIAAAVVGSYKKDYPFLSQLNNATSLEGYLFPDTYKVFADTTSDDIIRRMLDNFRSKVSSDIMDQANKKGLTLHEFITLTSIVEKESAHSEDIRKISSVYWNRLRDGMHFQSDATITYITKRPDPRPTYDETKIDHPYNTYIHAGLPPGPVGNPGMSAILATLDPETTPYFFFVSKGNRAYFAETYEGHLDNIAKYLD